jgi:hypothetical protein
MGTVAAQGHGLARMVELHQLDLDTAVHADDEFIMAGGIPRRGALGPGAFDDIFEVLADRDALIGARPARHLEHVGEDVILRIVVDDLDAALGEIVDGGEDGCGVGHANFPDV